MAVPTADGPEIKPMDYKQYMETEYGPDSDGTPTAQSCASWVVQPDRNTFDIIQKMLHSSVLSTCNTDATRGSRISKVAPHVTATLALKHLDSLPGLPGYAAGQASTLYDQLAAALDVTAIPKPLLLLLAPVVKLDLLMHWPASYRKFAAALVVKPAVPLTNTTAVVRAFLEEGGAAGDWGKGVLLAAMNRALQSDDYKKVTKVSSGWQCKHRRSWLWHRVQGETIEKQPGTSAPTLHPITQLLCCYAGAQHALPAQLFPPILQVPKCTGCTITWDGIRVQQLSHQVSGILLTASTVLAC
jgi:hypothetical protein